jgi:hypothetical protein
MFHGGKFWINFFHMIFNLSLLHQDNTIWSLKLIINNQFFTNFAECLSIHASAWGSWKGLRPLDLVSTDLPILPCMNYIYTLRLVYSQINMSFSWSCFNCSPKSCGEVQEQKLKCFFPKSIYDGQLIPTVQKEKETCRLIELWSLEVSAPWFFFFLFTYM